jgi:FtsH-binding integral membrane protein
MANSSIYNSFFGKARANMKAGAKQITNLMSLMNEKKEFLILVFSNLIVQLGITYYVMQNTNNPNLKKGFYLLALFLMQIIIIFVLALVPMPSILKFFVFCVFSYLSGLMLSILKTKASNEMINVAIQGALTVFAVFLASGVALFLGGINLGYQFGAILFWSLLLLIIAKLIFAGTMQYGQKILSFIGIIFFAFYVLYDTNIILQRNYYGDFVTASMDYYLDILNLFVNFLISNEN